MKHPAVRSGLLLTALACSVLAIDSDDARAQKPPIPTPAPVAPPSQSQTPSPTTPNVAGISVGAPMSVVDAKCKEAGVKCAKRVRRVSGQVLDRVRLLLAPTANPTFKKVQVTAKGGTVFAVKGTYRSTDKDRHQALTKTMGPSTTRRGAASWAAANGIVTTVNRSGRSIQYIDTNAAKAKGLNLAPQAFVTPQGGAPSLSPQNSPTSGPLRLPGDAAISYTASPTVTSTLSIPVKLTVLKLKCVDEQDLTSVVYGDDPYMHIVGVHTTFEGDTKAWYKPKVWGDIEEDAQMDVSVEVFGTNSDAAHKRLRYGEAIGAQISLSEADDGDIFNAVTNVVSGGLLPTMINDDEIDFAFPIVDYAWAESHQNSTKETTQHLIGDGADYSVTYRVEIGPGTPDPRNGLSALPFYRPLDAKRFAGSFTGFVGDQPAEVNLTFVASKDPAFPVGAVYGGLKDGATSTSVRTTRLEGSSIELFVKYPTGSPGELSGYLVGENADRIAGTLTRDGVSRGVVLVRK